MPKTTTITAEVELIAPKKAICAETTKAVLAAARKIKALWPASRKHALFGKAKEYDKYLFVAPHSVLGWSIGWTHYSEWSPHSVPGWNFHIWRDDQLPESMDSDERGIYSFIQGDNSPDKDLVGYKYSSNPPSIDMIRLFAKDIKSGRLAAELKKKLAIEEAKEAAEVKLFQQQQQEEASLVEDLS